MGHLRDKHGIKTGRDCVDHEKGTLVTYGTQCCSVESHRMSPSATATTSTTVNRRVQRYKIRVLPIKYSVSLRSSIFMHSAERADDLYICSEGHNRTFVSLTLLHVDICGLDSLIIVSLGGHEMHLFCFAISRRIEYLLSAQIKY